MFGCLNFAHPFVPPSNPRNNSTHPVPPLLTPQPLLVSPPPPPLPPPPPPPPRLDSRDTPSPLSHARSVPCFFWHAAPCRPRASPPPPACHPSPLTRDPY
jgi:hypothetical protein